jgi:hypothetical protein
MGVSYYTYAGSSGTQTTSCEKSDLSEVNPEEKRGEGFGKISWSRAEGQVREVCNSTKREVRGGGGNRFKSPSPDRGTPEGLEKGKIK